MGQVLADRPAVGRGPVAPAPAARAADSARVPVVHRLADTAAAAPAVDPAVVQAVQGDVVVPVSDGAAPTSGAHGAAAGTSKSSSRPR